MGDDKHYDHKTVQTVRGTADLVIRKMQKDGWEYVDQTAGSVRTALRFRRPKRRRLNLPTLATVGGAALLVAVIAVGVLLEDDRDDTGPVPPAAGPANERGEDRVYESENELIDAAVAAGYPCPARRVEGPTGLRGIVTASCSDNDFFQILGLTRQGAELEEFIDGIVHDPEHAPGPADAGNAYLVGANWVIYGRRDSLDDIRQSVGGTIATPLGH